LNVLDQYATSAPSAQNALDILAGSWVSKLPPPLADLQAGHVPLFDDPRPPWAAEQLGSFEGRTVLELGSFEGGHTYQIERLGAAAILGIEANTSAYLRSLIVKELLEIRRARFVCGDFVAFLRENHRMFDVCFASGVLYHMRNPAELIALIARATDRVLLWTHYYDHAILSRRPDFVSRFPGAEPQATEYQGFTHRLYRQQYQSELDLATFCGGSAPYRFWMTRDDILACLRYFGFDDLRVGLESPDHGGGPSFAVAAIRTRADGRPRREAELFTGGVVAHDGVASEELRATALLDGSFTRRPVNEGPEPPRRPAKALEEKAQYQDQYIKSLEGEIQRKNDHITYLELLVKRIEAGRLIRLLGRIRLIKIKE
jgi:SAM-dependent methyltransferase